MRNLDLDEGQARGGAGLIFKFAQEKLSSGEFGQLSEIVPEIQDLINDAPESGGLLGALGGLASVFGGKAEGMGNLANIVAGFSKLGLDSEMFSKFIPVILDFLQDKGGERIKNILDSVIKPE